MRRWAAAVVSLLVSFPAAAQLTIEVTGAGAERRPVAILPFAGEAALGTEISAVVRADLERSGLFRALELPRLDPPLTENSAISYVEWRARLADALVAGSVAPRADGRFEARFRLHDVVKGRDLGGVAYVLERTQARATAHRIADYVYERLTGEKGVFSTKIAYVVKRGSRYELQIADADGAHAQALLVSNEPILSPAWSPDGKRIAYVSLQTKKPVVYVQHVEVPKQEVVANFRGSNSAPAWAPDGRRLAVTLSRDGGSQLYLINADGTGVRRLTTSNAIDTEPSFSPDGRYIYFTSDRGGSPQIYRLPAEGGEAQRLTFTGSYNATPRPSPDGRSLAFVTRTNGKFRIALMDLATGQVQLLTDGERDESPSVAPNGRMILYATVVDGRGVLAAVSADGRVRQRLTTTAADVREPAWSPLLQP